MVIGGNIVQIEIRRCTECLAELDEFNENDICDECFEQLEAFIDEPYLPLNFNKD